MAPTTITPWMALAPDMSGRVEHGRHLADHLVADEGGQDEDEERVDKDLRVAAPRSCLRLSAASERQAPPAVASFTILPPWVMVAPFVISSSKSRVSFPSLTRWSTRVWMFFAYIWLAWVGKVAGRFGEADDRDVVDDDLPARLGQLAVAAGLGGHVHDDAARLHGRRPSSAVISFGAGRPGMRAVVITKSAGLDPLGDQLALPALVVVVHLAGIAAGRLGRGLLLIGHRDLDEDAAQALDLLLDDRAHVDTPRPRRPAGVAVPMAIGPPPRHP